MKGFVSAVLVAAVVLLAGVAGASTTTGTCTVAKLESRNWVCVTIAWMANTYGNVINNDTSVIGEIMRVEFSEDATSVPTALYDVTLVDAQGLDVLMGLGMNQSATAIRNLVFDGNASMFSTTATTMTVNLYTDYHPFKIPTYGTLILNVTNAGVYGKGAIRIYCKNNV